jgi:hypothetical protein
MLNLHAPFRWATPEDRAGWTSLLGGSAPGSLEGAVLVEEAGRITAVLSGEPDGETWRIRAVAVAANRMEELAPRILAVADALAADEGLLSVSVDAGPFGPDMLAMLDREGFRPSTGQGGSRWLVRPVVPQG